MENRETVAWAIATTLGLLLAVEVITNQQLQAAAEIQPNYANGTAATRSVATIPAGTRTMPVLPTLAPVR